MPIFHYHTICILTSCPYRVFLIHLPLPQLCSLLPFPCYHRLYLVIITVLDCILLIFPSYFRHLLISLACVDSSALACAFVEVLHRWKDILISRTSVLNAAVAYCAHNTGPHNGDHCAPLQMVWYCRNEVHNKKSARQYGRKLVWSTLRDLPWMQSFVL